MTSRAAASRSGHSSRNSSAAALSSSPATSRSALASSSSLCELRQPVEPVAQHLHVEHQGQRLPADGLGQSGCPRASQSSMQCMTSERCPPGRRPASRSIRAPSPRTRGRRPLCPGSAAPPAMPPPAPRGPAARAARALSGSLRLGQQDLRHPPRQVHGRARARTPELCQAQRHRHAPVPAEGIEQRGRDVVALVEQVVLGDQGDDQVGQATGIAAAEPASKAGKSSRMPRCLERMSSMSGKSSSRSLTILFSAPRPRRAASGSSGCRSTRSARSCSIHPGQDGSCRSGPSSSPRLDGHEPASRASSLPDPRLQGGLAWGLSGHCGPASVSDDVLLVQWPRP